MKDELSNTIKILQRKLRLSEQALKQNSSISKKYAQTLSLLKEKEHFTSTVIESNKNAIIAIDEKQLVTIFNKSAEKMFGFSKNEMLNRDSLHNIIPKYLLKRHSLSIEKFINTRVATNIIGTYMELEAIHKDGTIFPIRIGFGVEITDEHLIIIANIEDISREKKSQKSLQELNASLEQKVDERTKELEKQKNMFHYHAYHDSLTDLFNRAMFNEILQESILKAQRNKTKLALFFIDLDRFKQINDSLGHDIGDIVLQSVSKRLKAKIRNSDILARLGGDEFTILMEPFDGTDDVVILAKKIISALEQPMHIDGHTLYVASSIGVSLYPEDGEDTLNLLKNADAAMYKAKDSGRNNYKFYSSEINARTLERITIESDLHHALEKEEFVVYYQPQTDGRTGKLIGMEALIRWNHPSLGLIPPDKFIPIAQETGLIVQLDRWVMRTAIKQVMQWYHMGLNPGVLAINLVMKQLQTDDFIDLLQELSFTTGMHFNCLELEVTEGGIMKNPQNAITILEKISNLGIELAIDDFGTGYSSLSYLKKLPIHKLKIDQSFVKELPSNEEDKAIAKAVIALAKSLNLRVIAEGVETEEQCDFLVQNGCQNIQGYFYSKPISANEMQIYLNEGQVMNLD